MIDDTYIKSHTIPNTQNIISNKLIINPYNMATINNNIQPTYCSYYVSNLLKSLGFDIELTTYYNYLQELIIPCEDHTDYLYHNNTYRSRIPNPNSELYSSITAPTQDIAVEWIRVNINIFIHVTSHETKRGIMFRCNLDKSKTLWGTPQKALNSGLNQFLVKRINRFKP